MADVPYPQRLTLEQFPAEPWARALVAGFNQFSTDVVSALRASGAVYKIINVTTTTDPADAFPIDVPVDGVVMEARVAMVLAGAPIGGVAVTARMLSLGLLRVSYISGLAADSEYQIRLAFQR